MNAYLKPLLDFTQKSAFNMMFTFDIAEGKLIAELENNRGVFLIFNDSKSYLILFYKSGIFDFIPDDDQTIKYYHLEKYEEVPNKLSEILIDLNKDSGYRYYSKKWWGILPEWIFLKPVFFEEKYLNIFLKEIESVSKQIDFQVDITSYEIDCINDWKSTKTKQHEN
jgi:hypothetical protein